MLAVISKLNSFGSISVVILLHASTPFVLVSGSHVTVLLTLKVVVGGSGGTGSPPSIIVLLLLFMHMNLKSLISELSPLLPANELGSILSPTVSAARSLSSINEVRQVPIHLHSH